MKKEKISSDELMADSLQVSNYLDQAQQSRLQVFHLGIEYWLVNYLKHYKKASPNLQFRIFLFSNFYGQRIERYIEMLEVGGNHIV